MRLLRLVVLAMIVLAVIARPEPVGAQAAPGPFVQQAFDRLMDEFITPPLSATLLTGGWEFGVTFVKEQTGHTPEVGAPALGGDRAADWTTFLGTYPALVDALVPSAQQVDLDRAIVRGMAASLSSRSTWLRAPGGPTVQSQTNYAGIGMRSNSDRIIVEVYAGGPAEAGDLRIGDQIIAVDGVAVEGATSAQMAERIRGEVGSTVRLTVRRANVAEPLVLELPRAEITVPWIEGRVLGGGGGYLRVRTFPQSGQNELDAAMANVGGASSLIIDLRAGGGGYWDTLRAVASRFVREGPLFERVDRQGRVNTLSTTGGYWGREIPLAVLVDASTSFDAETLAAVLRERAGARIIGTKTSGSAGGTNMIQLPEGSTLFVQNSLIQVSQGVKVSGTGVEPDETVELSAGLLIQGEDGQLEAAVAYLKARLGSP